MSVPVYRNRQGKLLDLPSVDALTREFNETLLTGMQTPAARKAMAAAFDASPARLGSAAEKAVSKRRRST